MEIIEKLNNHDFPLKWANLHYFPESIAIKKEIYLINDKSLVDDLIIMFFTVFGSFKKNLYIYNESWWDFCLDTWDNNKDEHNYEIEGKSNETKDYMQMLKGSYIENEFSGSCICNNWDKFLSIVLKCIVNHIAPYSPIFYSETKDFFFYFHHSGSIGLYYNNPNEAIDKILKIANGEYEIR